MFASHFLKNIVTKARAIESEREKLRMFVMCFSLLQTSICIDEFLKHYEDIIILYTSLDYTRHVDDAFDRLSTAIGSRDGSFEEWILKKEEAKDKQAENEKEFFDEDDKEVLIDGKSIKAFSPYTTYFSDIRTRVSEIITKSIKDSGEDKIQNEYYNTQLFSIINDNLHIMPMWTGVILGDLSRHFNNDFY